MSLHAQKAKAALLRVAVAVQKAAIVLEKDFVSHCAQKAGLAVTLTVESGPETALTSAAAPVRTQLEVTFKTWHCSRQHVIGCAIHAGVSSTRCI